MDGNGRWAASRGLSVAEGHREGARALRRTVEAAIDLDVRSLAVYAFSTENWARPPDEVESIMELLDETIDRELPDLARQGVRTRFFGRRDRIPDTLREKMAALEAETAGNDRLHLWIAFDYGSRAELVEAVRQLVADGVRPEDVSEQAVAERLFAPELPDPDLVIRTSGEQRLSNFLLWQSAYAELVFTDTLWPDFGEDELRAALEEYARRGRRFGSSMSPLLSRILVAAILLPLVIGLVYLGGWWLFGLALVAGLLALHELYRMARERRPLVIAGYVGFVLTLLGLQLGDLPWMLGGILATLFLSFVFYGLSDIRVSATTSFGDHAARGRLGGRGARAPAPRPGRPRARLLGRHRRHVHRLRGGHGRVLRRSHARAAQPRALRSRPRRRGRAWPEGSWPQWPPRS